jgi:hypothetical protein
MNMSELDRQQLVDAKEAEATSEAVYVPPRVVYLGSAVQLIRGAYSSGYTDSTHDWYSTGE